MKAIAEVKVKTENHDTPYIFISPLSSLLLKRLVYNHSGTTSSSIIRPYEEHDKLSDDAVFDFKRSM